MPAGVQLQQPENFPDVLRLRAGNWVLTNHWKGWRVASPPDLQNDFQNRPSCRVTTCHSHGPAWHCVLGLSTVYQALWEGCLSVPAGMARQAQHQVAVASAVNLCHLEVFL